MESILSIAARHGVRVVEDNAHGLFSRYQGKYTGTFGCLATQSFHETKNFTCGEGGALIVNDTDLLERALVIREKGTDRSRFFRGEVDKYTRSIWAPAIYLPISWPHFCMHNLKPRIASRKSEGGYGSATMKHWQSGLRAEMSGYQ
jgi:hypothetical protein